MNNVSLIYTYQIWERINLSQWNCNNFIKQVLQLCTDAIKAPWQQTQKNISQQLLSRLVFIYIYYVVHFCSVSCQSITRSIWVGVIVNKYSKSMCLMQYRYIPSVLLWCTPSAWKHQWLVSSTTSVTCLVAFDWNRNSVNEI